MVLVTFPSATLRKKSEYVTFPLSSEDEHLIDEMTTLMYSHKGAAISAIQVGVPKRIIVIHPNVFQGEISAVVINPTLDHVSDETVKHPEGCLSFPRPDGPGHVLIDIERPVSCHITFQEADGKLKKHAAGGFLARVLLHELDHLEGKLFTDHMGSVKRAMFEKKYSKLVKEAREKFGR